MAEKAEVKVVLDTREAEAKAVKLRKKAERAERAVQRSEGGGLIAGRRAPLGARLRAQRAGRGRAAGGGLRGRVGAAIRGAGSGGVGAFAGKAGRAAPLLIAAEIARRGASGGAAVVGGFAGEFAQAAAAFGLTSDSIPALEGQIRGLSLDVQRILSGDFIKDFLELERVEAAKLFVDFAGEGVNIGASVITGDVGKAFARSGRRDRVVSRKEGQRKARGAVNAIKYGAGDLWDEIIKNLGGG